MADISKIKIDSTTYNIKDSTARTTANGKLSDAPSDDKQYARQNGAWVEVEATGSGVPAGGTIGQVLVKNSSTDGDAGWYTPGHYPTDKWYLIDGVTESNVVAAYQFVGRESEAEALININDGTKYPLSKNNNGVTWSATNGFYIPAIAGAGLNNSSLYGYYNSPTLGTMSMGFSDASTASGDILIGGFVLHWAQSLAIRGGMHSISGNSQAYANAPVLTGAGGCWGGSDDDRARIAGTKVGAGVLTGCWGQSKSIWHNGQQLSVNTSIGERTDGCQIGNGIICQHNGVSMARYPNLGTFRVTAIAIYNTIISNVAQIELYNNIHSLGGI